MKAPRLPPFCGQGLRDEFLYNPYQVELLNHRRMRICPKCATIAMVDGYGVFRCPKCGTVEPSQLIARKAFHRIAIVGGRRSGKTKVGAHAAREECVVPNGLGWCVGPSFKILHDATMPAFFKLIPPDWVKHWDAQNYQLTLRNDHIVQFRSLDDPSRGVGVGLWWCWLDEAQKIKERAWDILRPSLTDNLGNAIFTFTPNGYDWTWRRIFRPAFEAKHKRPGFWAAQCRTTDNPWIQKYAMHEIEEARSTMPPAMFRQEYEASFESFSGNVYDWDVVQSRILSPDALRSFLPEYPKLNRDAFPIFGLGGGVTHPFAAAMVVPTPKGLVVVDEYIDTHRSVDMHRQHIMARFHRHDLVASTPFDQRWACDEAKEYVHKEFARRGVGVIPTETYLMAGIQRLQTWLYSEQFFFASTVERTLDQMREYRWNDAGEADEERKDEERDFQLNEELPKALHAAVLSYPELPKLAAPTMTAREMALDPRVREDIAELARALRAEEDPETADFDNPFEDEERPVDPGERHWPLGDFYRDF